MELMVARAKRRVTQWQLRLVTGISQSKLSLIENGYIAATYKEKSAISSALGVDVDEIEWPTPKWGRCGKPEAGELKRGTEEG